MKNIRKFNENVNEKDLIVDFIKERLKIFQRESFSDIKYDIDNILDAIEDDYYSESKQQKEEDSIINSLNFIKKKRKAYNDLISKIMDCENLDNVLELLNKNGLSKSDNDLISNKVVKLIYPWLDKK